MKSGWKFRLTNGSLPSFFLTIICLYCPLSSLLDVFFWHHIAILYVRLWGKIYIYSANRSRTWNVYAWHWNETSLDKEPQDIYPAELLSRHSGFLLLNIPPCPIYHLAKLLKNMPSQNCNTIYEFTWPQLNVKLNNSHYKDIYYNLLKDNKCEIYIYFLRKRSFESTVSANDFMCKQEILTRALIYISSLQWWQASIVPRHPFIICHRPPLTTC